ncbi:MAG: CopD family protein [Reichenbachiella sp.]
MIYLYLKSLHIILVVTWFAGLFYLVRLFIYTTEANNKNEPDKSILLKQLTLMQNRLWSIITHPSALLTLFIGTWLSIETKFYSQPWFHVKILFVVGLYVYHFLCNKIRKDMNNGIFKYSSSQLRLWNEVATLLLFSIVFIVVLKSTMTWIWGVVGLISLGVLLMLGIKIYKRYRND